MKEISLNDTVYNLVKQYPEIRELIISLGFEPLRSDKMLNTAGRIMTIGKALKRNDVPEDAFVETLAANRPVIRENRLLHRQTGSKMGAGTFHS
ncbi:DUF1858 domain-containing protein [uncultured Trichococcus sp.]|uniref:DUF1858 domain-containing protein n=1 Tax=uncultured Trichococcus sp. TaxID=189665 RepID=UPI0029C81C9D|nr:DUF1858 domain-containing protein [uncultured Trichococcus sp.]